MRTLDDVLREAVKEVFNENAVCVPRNGKHESIKLSDPATWYYRFEVSPDCLHNFTDKIDARLRANGVVMVEDVEEIVQHRCKVPINSSIPLEILFIGNEILDDVRALCGEKGDANADDHA